MNAATSLAMGFAVAFAMMSSAHAQGRHDERPHGTQKPSSPVTEPTSPGGPMGRHDERPHGPRKPAAKVPDAKAPGSTSGAEIERK